MRFLAALDRATVVRAILLLGAAVRADGSPSPALARRIGYAAQAAAAEPDALVFCSGAAGKVGPSEASVMGRVLEARGVHPSRLVLDEVSRDTLESVVAAAEFVRRRGLDGCIVCTDAYHVRRARWLLGALGVRSEPGPITRGRAGTRLAYWTRMRLRESLATPYDLALVLFKRGERGR